VSYEDRKSTRNSRARKETRRGSVEEEVRKHRDRITRSCKQRRRVDITYDPSMAMALRPGTWIDEERFKKTCIKENPKRETIHQPSYGAWVADFMLRQDAGKSMLEKYLSDNSIEAKETFGDGSGRNYSNSQTVNQNRQDAISRVSAVEESARGPRCKH